MHNLIMQSFLPMVPIFQADHVHLPLHITALVAYSQQSHTTKSMLQSIKTHQCQVAVLQQAFSDIGHALDDDHKSPAKPGPLPKQLPHTTQESPQVPLWEGKTLPKTLMKHTFIGKTWYLHQMSCQWLMGHSAHNSHAH